MKDNNITKLCIILFCSLIGAGMGYFGQLNPGTGALGGAWAGLTGAAVGITITSIFVEDDKKEANNESTNML